jgi:hypothetical protein
LLTRQPLTKETINFCKASNFCGVLGKDSRQVCVYTGRVHVCAEHNEWPLKMLQFGGSRHEIDRARDNAAPARRGKNTHHQVRNDGLQQQPVLFFVLIFQAFKEERARME